MIASLHVAIHAQTPPPPTVHAIATTSYAALRPDELSFAKDDYLFLTGASSEDGWAYGRRHLLDDAATLLLPLGHVRLIPPASSEIRTPPSSSTSAAGAAFSAAIVAANTAADEAERDASTADPAVRAAIAAYRRRRAAHNGNAALLEQRWGVRLDLDSNPPRSHHTIDEEQQQTSEHRSGIGGIPFFNLVEHMDADLLSSELCAMLRSEWLPDDISSIPDLLSDLSDTLKTVAASSKSGKDLILTFANLGYTDFVTNGFEHQKANTLIISLDPKAHDLLVSRGFHSYFDPRMPTMPEASALHTSAAFMDIMKLRLLYLAEVLQRGYNALLTDADAVFDPTPPFAVFPPNAHLVVACDSTVVPATWSASPGMVMAGFFYARGGTPRTIIFIKEVLDYQLRHPEQHDQQSLNQILSELLVADMTVSVMHPRLFPNGFQYFHKRTVQREGIPPLVIQNNWIAGAENKRHRFREALLWKEDDDEYYAGTSDQPLRLLRYDATQPIVSGLLRETSALKAAMRIALLTNRILLLPSTCSFTNSSGLVPPPPLTYRGRDGSLDENVLDDTVDADWCTTEWFFDMGSMKEYLEGTYREGAFLEHPKAKAAFRLNSSSASPSFFIEASPEWRLLPPQPHATILHPSNVSAGATDEEIRKWFTPHAEVPIIDLGDMAGRVQMPNDSAAEEAALSERITNGIVYREEISRYVRQQVTAASPFECLCIPSPPAANESTAADASRLASFVERFTEAVPPSTTVFLSSYRVDLDTLGLDAFEAVWRHVYALALYDWNGSGLQGRQFSSVINRLVCEHAERVHWPDGRGQNKFS